MTLIRHFLLIKAAFVSIIQFKVQSSQKSDLNHRQWFVDCGCDDKVRRDHHSALHFAMTTGRQTEVLDA